MLPGDPPTSSTLYRNYKDCEDKECHRRAVKGMGNLVDGSTERVGMDAIKAESAYEKIPIDP